MMYKFHTRPRDLSGGYITLLGVLIVGAVATTMTVSLLLFGVDATKSALLEQQRVQATALAHTCVEVALGGVRVNPHMTGNGSVALGQGSCTYSVLNTGGQGRAIATEATVGTIVRKVQVTVSAINPRIIITSWQEVP
jgi:hypothetical protein